MVDILLNIIYACRAGNGDLLIECIRKVIPYAFGYDNIIYARYLSAMLGDMLTLEEDHPEVYAEFCSGNFTVQLSENKFSRTESDKVIEMTLNRDSKTPGGTTGFSINTNTVKHWEVNSSYRASLRSVLHQYLHVSKKSHAHKDVTPARIKKDESSVQEIMSVLQQTFIHPFSEEQLLSISTGLLDIFFFFYVKVCLFNKQNFTLFPSKTVSLRLVYFDWVDKVGWGGIRQGYTPSKGNSQANCC